MRSPTILKGATIVTIMCGCSATVPESQTHVVRTRVHAASRTEMDLETRYRDYTNEQHVDVTTVKAFDELPAAYTRLGIPTVAVVDTTGGVYAIGVRNMRVRGSLGGTRLSRYLDCGGSAMRSPVDTYDLTISATTFVTPSAGGATLHTLLRGEARDPSSNAPPVRCISTGTFEQRLAQLVQGK